MPARQSHASLSTEFWERAARKGWETSVSRRSSYTGAEKEVDIKLSNRLLEDAFMTANHEPDAVLALVSGDGDFADTISTALRISAQCSVEVWGWEGTISRRVLAIDDPRFSVW